MRFASKYRRYKITARRHETMTLANGMSNILHHGVICEFQHGGLREWEKEKATARFKFRGTTQEADQVTPVDPSSRLAYYDTDEHATQWAEWDLREIDPVTGKHLTPGTIKAEVEAFLTSYRSFGIDYMLLEPDPVTAPWPAYDDLKVSGKRTAALVAERHLQVAFATGVPVEALIAYERQTRAHPEILQAYEDALLEPAQPEEDLVEA